MLLAFLCLAAPALAPDGVYRLIQVKGAVSLYERWVEITPGNKVREMKAEFEADATPEEALDLFKDPKRQNKWRSSLDDYQIIDLNGADSWVAYSRYRIPWPMDNQDMVLCYQAHRQAKGAIYIAFQSCEHASFPPMKSVARVGGISGTYHFQPKSNGKIQATYTAISTHKSSMPRSVTDPILQNNLLNTLNAFCRVAQGG
jgi:hypothetical protein